MPARSDDNAPDSAGASPIQVVSRRTGLTPELIRKWEDRYGAVTPRRSPTRRRLYTDRDIERLARLKRLTAAGWRISDIAGHDDDRLAELLAGVEAPQTRTVDTGRKALPGADELRAALVAAVGGLDATTISSVLERAALALSLPDLLERVVAPTLVDVGAAWARGDIRCSQEHAASAAVRTFLGDTLRGLPPAPGGPTFASGTLTGQAHEFGALMAAITAASLGWRPLYLGPGLPAVELAYAAVEARARVVAVSLTHPADDPSLARELRLLCDSVPADCHVIAGGAASGRCLPPGGHPRLTRVDTLAGLREVLSRLRGSPDIEAGYSETARD